MTSGVGTLALVGVMMTNKARGLGTKVTTSGYDSTCVGLVNAAAVVGTELTINVLYSTLNLCIGTCHGNVETADYTVRDGS